MAAKITIHITKEDIIQLAQDKAGAHGLCLATMDLKNGGPMSRNPYDIQVETTWDSGTEEDCETSLADIRCSFCPVIGLSVTVRPQEVK